MKIAVLGFGDQGKSALKYWGGTENELTVCDLDLSVDVPKGAKAQLGPGYLAGLNKFDLLIRTPALHPRDIEAANPETPRILDKVTTVTNEFFKVCPSRNIIGVTGTKGKGTTSAMITKMLEAAGKNAHLGGNIGTPPLAMLKKGIKPDDWVVLELANFQLIDLKYSPPVAVCLMIAPEHLDWHEDLNEYLTSKQQLFRWQKKSDIAVFYADSRGSEHVVSVSSAKKVPYFRSPGAEVIEGNISINGQLVCAVSDLKLLGKHNWQNACAAVTAAWFSLGSGKGQIDEKIDAIRSVLTTFAGLEHRLEFVREVDGVKFFDDSFGTAPETAIVAMEAFKEPKILILGGSDKGADYARLAEAVAQHDIRHIVAIGERAETILESIDSVKNNHQIPRTRLGKDVTMSQIVQTAKTRAKEGDIVLLSPACASFDMFKNYKDRGRQFKRAVQAL